MAIIKLFGPFERLDTVEEESLRSWVEKECSNGLIDEEHFTELVMSEVILQFTENFCKYGNGSLKDFVSVNTELVFVCLYYSNSGKSEIRRFVVNSSTFRIIFFDCKLIYETICLLAFSPLSRNGSSSLLDDTLSIFKLSLSGRLASHDHGQIQFLSLGLAAKGSLLTVSFSTETKSSIFLADLLETSGLSYKECRTITFIIGNFILFHELGHYILSIDSVLKTKTLQNIEHTVKTLEYFGINGQHKMNPFRSSILKGIHEVLGSNNPIDELDLQECCCDMFSISNTFMLSSIDRDMIPLIRSVFGFTLQIINLNIGYISYFKDLVDTFEDIQRRFPKMDASDKRFEEWSRRIDDFSKERFDIALKKWESHRAIHGYRQLLNEYYLDAMVNNELKLINKNVDGAYDFSPLTQENHFYSEWAKFEKQFVSEISKELLSVSNNIELFKLGKCLNSFSNNVDTFDSKIDPFFIYLFSSDF